MNIEKTEKGFKITENIDIDKEINNMLDFENSFINQINRKIITDKNEAIIQALLNRINQAIEYIEGKEKIQYKYTLSQIEISELLKILKGE